MIKLFDYGNCEDAITGTGLANCDTTEWGDLKGVIPFNKGWSASITDDTVDFGLSKYIENIKYGLAHPLNGIYDFAQNTPDNEQNTSSLGVIQEVRLGKPQFDLMFAKGGCFHKTLFNKRGQGRWDFALLFDSGLLFATNSDATELKAFDGGMFSVETFKLKQGTDLQMSTAKLQLLDAIEFNQRFVFIPYSKAGDIDKVQGVIETKIVLDPIASGADSFTASITSACNTGDSVLDLDNVANFVMSDADGNNFTIASVSQNATTGKYLFSVAPNTFAFEEVLTLTMNDGTYSVIEDTTGNLYKGTSNAVTVSA